MINRRAILDYMNRPLRDSRKAKRFTNSALDAKLMKAGAQFKTIPYIQQKVCFLLGVKHPCYLFFLDTGLGKTKVTLDLLRFWKQQRKVKTALVLVPNAANVGGWLEEVQAHAPDLKAIGIQGDRANRLEVLDTQADLMICTYMGWLALVCKHQAKKLVLDQGKAKDYGQRFQMLVMDESTNVKNHNSLTFRVLRQLVKHCPVRYALTATPFGRDPQDLWSQFYLIDEGETLGETLGLYRAAMFTEAEDYWSGGKVYTFDVRKRALLNRLLRHNSIRYTAEECMDMPKLNCMVRTVHWPKETWAYYEKLLQQLRQAAKDRDKRENLFLRMRQMTAGFLSVGEGEQKQELVFTPNAKLEALIEWVGEVPLGRKVIIFHEYKKSGALICEALVKAKVRHVRLAGGMGAKANQVIDRFKQEAEVRVLVASSAGAYGLNLQVANYVGFYESTTRPILRKQMIARVYRNGQRRSVFVYDFVVHNSVDEKNLAYLAQGEDLRVAVVDGKEKLNVVAL